MQAGKNKEGLDRDEVAQAIRELLPGDMIRLKKAASMFALYRPIGAEDLLQEAFTRSLDGRRVCPRDVNVVFFLVEVMRSVVHGEKEKVANKLATVSISSTGEAEDAALSVPDPSIGADERLVNSEETSELRQSILGLFEDDSVAQIIVEGMMDDELTGDDLRELSGLDAKSYASKRRLIRRRIDKAYPKGRMS